MRSFDIHQHITNQILAMLDRPRGDFHLPWRVPGSILRPRNAVTGKAYQGINILALWAAAEGAGYASGVWATYRQWASLGAQVRKGEKSTYMVFYKEIGSSQDDGDAPTGETGVAADQHSGKRLITRASAVFSAEQVDGYEPPVTKPVDPVQAVAHAAEFVAATGATIHHDGHRPLYRPSTDDIQLPPTSAFIGSRTSTPTEAYFATLLHELCHWTGHASRCDRDLGGRFGDQAYAMEELIAELGSAFLCADLQVTPRPRADHAHYLASWLSVLRSDNKAIFTAASKASQAAAYLHGLQPSDPIVSDPAREGSSSPAAALSSGYVDILAPSLHRSFVTGAVA